MHINAADKTRSTIMHTKFIMPVIDTECPKGKDEKNCSLRKFLKETKLFKISNNIMIPTAELYRIARREYVLAFESMHQICNKCQEAKKEKIK